MHPILMQIGEVQIRWYGMMIALAFLAGTLLGIREARRKGYDPELVYDLLFFSMLASIAGASAAPQNIPLHPTQFYEMGADFAIFLMIWFLRKQTRFPGQLFLIYVMTYAVVRFGVEIFRGDSLMIIGNYFKAAQTLSIILFIAGFVFYLLRGSASKRDAPEPVPVSP